MKYIITVIILFIATQLYRGQSLQFSWSHDTIGSNKLLMKTDASANLYVYYPSIGPWLDFDKTAATYTLNNSLGNAAIAKYSSDGALVWAKNFGGTGNTTFTITDFEIASSGNIYLTGYFYGMAGNFGYNTTSSIDINPSPLAVATLTNQNGPDCVVAKFDANCNYVWGFSFGNNQQYTLPCGLGGTCYYTRGVYPTCLSIDQNENVYVGGSVSGTGNDCDPGAGVINLSFTSGADGNGFYVKYNSAGIYQYSQLYSTFNHGSYPSSRVYDLVVDNNNDLVVSAQSRQASIDLDPGASANNQGSSGVMTACLAKYNPTGNIIWGYGRTTMSIGFSSLKINSQNDIFALGANGLTNCNLIGAATTSFNGVPVLKYNSSAVLQYGFLPNSSSNDILDYDIKSPDEIFVAGKCAPLTDFDPSAAIYTLTPFSNRDGYISKYNGTSLQYAYTFGASPTSYQNQLGSVCHVNNHIYVAGVADGTSDLDFTPGGSSIRQNTFTFLAKYFECYAPQSPSDLTPLSSRTLCEGGSTNLIATSTGSITWYTPASTLSVGNGTSFSTGTLTAGNYTYLAEAKTCTVGTNLLTLTITVFPNPSVSVNGGSVCAGQAFTIQPTGAFTYSITGGNFTVSPAITSSYIVTGKDLKGCTDSTGAICNIIVHPLPAVSISGRDTICTGENLVLTANGATSYSWNNGSAVQTITVQPAFVMSFIVTGTDSLGCQNSYTKLIATDNCTDLNERNSSNTPITFFPNPVQKTLTLVTDQSMEYELTGCDGKIYTSGKTFDNVRQVINVEHLAPGIYTLRCGPHFTKLIKAN